jgi:predicted HTH domain antitoxin
MPLIISDESLKAAGLTEQEAKVEIACRLFDAEKMSKGAAARLAGLSRSDFESALIQRGLPLVRYTEEMLKQDAAAIKQMEEDDQ